MAGGTFDLLMPFTEARCMRITSRKGSRLMYQPGQAPPGMVGAVLGALASLSGRTKASVPTLVMPAPRFVSDKFFFVGSVAGTNGWHCSAMRLEWREASALRVGVAAEGLSPPGS